MRNLLALMLLAPLLSWGDEQILECPRTVEVKSAVQPRPGWQLVVPVEPNVLERVGFFSGHPSARASLVPDKTQTGNGASNDIWNFLPAAPGEPWLACYYTGTSLVIAKPVAKQVRRCEVRYKATRAGSRLSVTAIRCTE